MARSKRRLRGENAPPLNTAVCDELVCGRFYIKPDHPSGIWCRQREAVNPEGWRVIWEELRESVMEWCEQFAGWRPWGWWQFEAPEPRRQDEPQAHFLRRHDLLAADEAQAIAEGGAGAGPVREPGTDPSERFAGLLDAG